MHSAKLFLTVNGPVVQRDETFFRVDADWDDLFQRDDLPDFLSRQTQAIAAPSTFLSVARGQEVWAAGVTYRRSRAARMDEAKASGGGDGTFYDKVYRAARPEIFFKAAGWRVKGAGEPVRIRRDSRWNVPEPELTLAINSRGRIFGYSVGNDMSSRDIEGENPLYLPQAKVYDGSAALGPGILVTTDPLPAETRIALVIARGGEEVFRGATEVGQIKRRFEELAEYLCRETSFPRGVFLMTGTGIVPPDTFTLQSGDVISITIDAIGTLTNPVE